MLVGSDLTLCSIISSSSSRPMLVVLEARICVKALCLFSLVGFLLFYKP